METTPKRKIPHIHIRFSTDREPEGGEIGRFRSDFTLSGEGGCLLHGGEEFHKEQLFLYKEQGLAFQIESNLIDQKLLGIALKQDYLPTRQWQFLTRFGELVNADIYTHCLHDLDCILVEKLPPDSQ